MRFSDMMGSGDDSSSKRPAPSGSEDVIADALAPYLDATAAAPAPSARPAASAAAAAFREPDDDPVFDSEADEPEVRLDVAPEPFAEVVPARVPTAISDLAPVSDDLLPRRR